jgi:hypothetical protein
MLFKDSELLESLYQDIVTESKKKNKPDFLDVDEDGNKKESLKKAVKDKKKSPMKEELTFNELYNRVISETRRSPITSQDFSPSAYSNTYEHDKKVLQLRRLSNGEISKINDEEQYTVTWKTPEKHNNQTEQPLKGESVHAFLDDIAAIRRSFPEEL